MDPLVGEMIAFSQRRLSAALRRLRVLLRDSSGVSLLESIVAVTVFTMVGGATLVGLSAIQRVRVNLERQAMAENIARNQMEYIFSLDYQTTISQYSSTTVPSGYHVTNVQQVEEIIEGDSNLQKITVTVSLDGEELLVLETYRTNEQAYATAQ